MSANRPASPLDQGNALAADCIPWRLVLPDGASRKVTIGKVGAAWYVMPAGSWSVREFRAAIDRGDLVPYPISD